MLPVLRSLLICLRDSVRTRVALQAEVLALRHQLLVLQRRNQKRRLQLSTFDRVLWVWLSGIWADWKSALRIVKPETVIASHRKGFRLYWRWKSRPRHGRPPVMTEVRELIRRMSAANPRWGAPRIHGELGQLGIKVSETTVAKYMVRHRNPPSQTWRTFLVNHVKDLASADFFVVPTATFRLLFVFVILSMTAAGQYTLPSPAIRLRNGQRSSYCRLSPRSVRDYVVFRNLPQRNFFRFSDAAARKLGRVTPDLAEVVSLPNTLPLNATKTARRRSDKNSRC